MDFNMNTGSGRDSFRDSVATISKEGKRRWIFPKMPVGRHYQWRKVVSIVLLALLFTGPFMRWNGHPFMLFNVIERKFILFGITFWPQDFFLFVLAMLSFFVFIILFTAVFGRVWCGWACPQTIFMEMVFRRVEYLIEGDSKQQQLLDARDWDFYKVRKKILKHSVFLILSFIIANTFLSYVIGVKDLWLLVEDGPMRHAGGFFSLMGFTGVFYGVYARFREQACLVVCPYGRLQGVLLDRNSVVIAYDYKRGEPRGKLHKDAKRSIGDCIDCHQCVDVCPTGIDIRNGTQLECVNCTACIDACDNIMQRNQMPQGLIRYTSENTIASGIPFKVTSRIIGYSILLVGLVVTLALLLASRSDVETTLLRTPGQLYQNMGHGQFSNLYNIQIVNKTFDEVPVRFLIQDVNGKEVDKAAIRFVGPPIERVPLDSIAEAVLFIDLPEMKLSGIKTTFYLVVESHGKIIDRVKTNFLGPSKKNIAS